MNPDFWIITALGGLLAVVWKSLKIIRWFKQNGNEKPKGSHPAAAGATPDPEGIFTAFLVACGIAFGVFLMLALTIHQKEPPSTTITLLVCLIGAVVVSGMLLLFVGVPFYKTMLDFSSRLRVVEGRQVQKESPDGQISVNRKPLKKTGLPKERHLADQRTRAIDQPKKPVPGRPNTTKRVKVRKTKKDS